MRRYVIVFILGLVLLCFPYCGSPAPSSQNLLPLKLTGTIPSLKTVSSSAATDVVAINPTARNAARFYAPIDGILGDFEIKLPGGTPYLLLFVDAYRKGTDMTVGYLASSDLEILPALLEEGSVDLGQISFSQGKAWSSIDHLTILKNLSVTTGGASFLGARDEHALKYYNPDIDGNGLLDVLETGRDFMLDLQLKYDVTTSDGTKVGVESLYGSFPLSSGTLSYQGGTQHLLYPQSYADSPSATSLRINDTSYSIDRGAGEWNGYYFFGHSFGAAEAIPAGTYVFGLGSKKFTFTNVQGRSVSDLIASNHWIVPFVRFDLVNSSCTSECKLRNLSWQWMKRNSSGTGFKEATLEELKLLVHNEGAYVAIQRGSRPNNTEIGFFIPTDQKIGTMEWTNDLAQTKLSFNIGLVKTSEICDVDVGYNDKVGNRLIFSYEMPVGCE